MLPGPLCRRPPKSRGARARKSRGCRKWIWSPTAHKLQATLLSVSGSSRSISSPVGASRVGSFFPKMYRVNTLRMRKRMCVLVSKIKTQELGCFLFRLLARVCVFACLWLRLGLCLHGGASVSLFAWCVPPINCVQESDRREVFRCLYISLLYKEIRSDVQYMLIFPNINLVHRVDLSPTGGTSYSRN